MEDSKKLDNPSKLLQMVEAIAIKPQDAKKIVIGYKKALLKKDSSLSEQVIQRIVAKKIVDRYSSYSALSGGVTSLSSIVPGVGTAVSMTGGALADVTYCMKIQVDMCMCLAETFGWDLGNEDAKHLSFLIAAGGALEKAGSEVAVKVASTAGVKMLKMYLKGAALETIKAMFKKIGINFTRKSLEKALPFGVGIAISSTANYGMTKYVGHVATKWFTIEQETRLKENVTINNDNQEIVVD
ncbi:hypothetical protein [Enterobacter kobei]|uniref:hypothetical protein n=1 Tax=Enterobacter kobei TaxID=208224 RepID=UPI0018A3D489|nr:hypothetical protein [Enterobacter kobei]BBV85997.1 hypothetical protein STW0522ENT62_14430 [Enterobacter kobei]